MEFLPTKFWMLAALLLVAVVFYLGLQKRNRNPTSVISLDDLLIGDDGKMSKAAAVMFVALGVTTWCMVYLTISEKLTEGYFGIYVGAWIAPTVTRLIVNRPQMPAGNVANANAPGAVAMTNPPSTDQKP